MLSEMRALRKPSQDARMPRARSDDFPMVSVVLPTYNGEDTLERCLDSIMAQDYPNFEVLISDDCSADSSASIAADFARRYPNVSFTANAERLGVWRNPCSGAMRAHGRYIHFAEQDDVLLPTFLFELTKLFLSRPTASAVTCTHVVKTNQGVHRYDMRYLYKFRNALVRAYNILTDVGRYGISDAEIFVTGLVKRDIFVDAINRIGDNFSSRVYVAYFAMAGSLEFLDEPLKIKFKTPGSWVRHNVLKKRKTRWHYSFQVCAALFGAAIKSRKISVATKLGLPVALMVYVISGFPPIIAAQLQRLRKRQPVA
jgi:glycosyltransferase involved in cell wall biosynthesis